MQSSAARMNLGHLISAEGGVVAIRPAFNGTPRVELQQQQQQQSMPQGMTQQRQAGGFAKLELR